MSLCIFDPFPGELYDVIILILKKSILRARIWFIDSLKMKTHDTQSCLTWIILNKYLISKLLFVIMSEMRENLLNWEMYITFFLPSGLKSISLQILNLCLSLVKHIIHFLTNSTLSSNGGCMRFWGWILYQNLEYNFLKVLEPFESFSNFLK